MSVASRNPEGLTEGELRKILLKETVPVKKYKARRRLEVSLDEREEIVDEYLKEYLPQKDIAQRHRVKTQLVSDLVYERKNNPEKHRVEKEKEKLAKDRTQFITETIFKMLNEKTVIKNAKMVC